MTKHAAILTKTITLVLLAVFAICGTLRYLPRVIEFTGQLVEHIPHLL